MIRKLYLLMAAICISLTLAAQQLHTTLDIRIPAKYTFPEEVLDLIVVNNTAQQPADFGHSTMQDEQAIGQVDIDLQTAPTFLLLGATQTLDYAQRFASVGFVPEQQNPTKTLTAATPLSSATIATLCHNFQADAALVCNQLVIYDVLGSFLTEDYAYYAYIEAYLVSKWALQFPDGRTQPFAFNDTLYWENIATSRYDAINGLPNRQQALLDMSQYAGERFAQQFVPQWETVDRYLYQDESEGVKRGLDAFYRKRWNNAINLWTNFYQQTDTVKKKKALTSRAYAAANIAVTYEIKDNLTEAIAWTDKAIQTFTRVNTADARQQAINLKYYRSQLEQRLKTSVPQ